MEAYSTILCSFVALRFQMNLVSSIRIGPTGYSVLACDCFIIRCLSNCNLCVPLRASVRSQRKHQLACRVVVLFRGGGARGHVGGASVLSQPILRSAHHSLSSCRPPTHRAQSHACFRYECRLLWMKRISFVNHEIHFIGAANVLLGLLD